MTSGEVSTVGTGADSRLSRTVLVANQKGGVGKSSIVTAVAALTCSPDRRVLVVDADQQANATRSDLGVAGDNGRNLAAAMQFAYPLEIVRDVRPGLDIVPGGSALAMVGAAAASASESGEDLGANLATALADLCGRERYSLVLVDSGPGDAPLLDALLNCVRYLVVPTKDDDASLAGVELLADRYLRARARGAAVELLGVILFDANPRATARNAEVLDQVDSLLEGSRATAFEALVRSDKAAAVDLRNRHITPSELVAVAEDGTKGRLASLRSGSTPAGERLWSRDPSGLAGDYQELTRELLQRVAAAERRTTAGEGQ